MSRPAVTSIGGGHLHAPRCCCGSPGRTGVLASGGAWPSTSGRALLAGPVRRAGRRVARRGADQPRQRRRLPFPPGQPARRHPRRADRGGRGPWARACAVRRRWHARRRRSAGPHCRRRRRGVGLRVRALRDHRAGPVLAGTTTSSWSSARRRNVSTRCWPVGAPQPCSTPATTSRPRTPGWYASSTSPRSRLPYLGTVLAVQGEPSPAVRSLAAALLETADDIRAGKSRSIAVDEAATSGLAPHLAERYVAGLLDADQGLVPGGTVDIASVSSVVELRRRHLPPAAAALLAGVVDPASGLIDDATITEG